MSMTVAEILFIVIFFLIMGPWFWRYKIRPYFAKSQLRQMLKNIAHHEDLEKRLLLLQSLFQRVKGNSISHTDRAKLGFKEDAFVYGEIDYLSFVMILDKVKPKSGEIFYDLGSGTGKAVFTAALCYDLSKAIGIELLPGLYAAANKVLQQLTKILKSLPQIEFKNANFLQYDFSDGDIIFINATCLDYYTWQAIVEKLGQLKPGSRVIVTTKKVIHHEFKPLFEGRELMSWGMNSLHIYVKIG